jgi:hypothetical protein
MKKSLIIVLALAIQACAFTDAKLKVDHSASADIVGPLSELEAIAFSQPELEDGRQDRLRIGWKKNGYGQNTADIFTEKEVTAIVENAVAEAVKDNGHQVSQEGAQVKVSGVVDRFWFEMDTNFWTVEFIGDVRATLDFTDAETGESIYKSTFSGTYSEKKPGGLEKTWSEVMSKAVDKLIEDIVFDENLAEALEERGQ